ncbi:cupredoxin domain-containing protein [Roseivirga sp. E12]|uniref:cupredoxin domain-containing protein n=1 Tax=Roseivirga sp. E12 TaxID=2819237 RepID=UPI001ABC5407|nr:cupredoxin domain-containing protein [Roseivirga sp. E12]MBO3698026.1 cupredoxin domain-containing protein [Roseivirga sp. E12]
MKRSLMIIALLVGFVATGFAQKDEAKVIKLDQTPGKFTTEALTLKPGKYIFEVTNSGVDHEVGFVIAPVTNGKEGDHIKAGYLPKAIKDGEKASSKVVELKAGTYNYFCPLNPTPHYQIIVKE